MTYQWVDRRFYIWVWPISSIIAVGMLVIMGWSIYMVILEDFGDKVAKKVFLIGFFSVLFISLVYLCVGLYQLFFIELRNKFIANKVIPLGEHYYMNGYYFKRAEFDVSEVAAVDEYPVKPRFGKNIVTALSWPPQTKQPNYKVTLRDGRVFYLPGDMTDVDELKTLLASKLSGK